MSTPGAPHGDSGRMPEGDVLGTETPRWALGGGLFGALVGGSAGYAYGIGALDIPGAGPLAAGGPAVPAFVFGAAAAALLALAGALAGTRRAAAAQAQHRGQGHEGAGHGGPAHGESGHGGSAHGGHSSHGSLIERLPVLGAIALAVLMGLSLLEIAASALGAGEPSDQASRITWNLKNSSRIGGARDEETAVHALQTAFPATRPENSPGAILEVPEDWRIALAATPLMAPPLNAAVIVKPGGAGSALLAGEARRLRAGRGEAPEGSMGGLSGLLAAVAAAGPAEVAAAVDASGAAAKGAAANVMIVAADADFRWALPAGAYAARTGTPILFVTRDGVPEATAAALRRRSGGARMFVLGPEEAVPEGILDELRRFGAVTRVAGDDFASSAVRFAELRDDAADFGWGRTGRGQSQWSAAYSILVNERRWQDGIHAAHLARAGKPGPLLYADRDALPPQVDRYLWAQRPAYASTPAEGPVSHIWVVGSFDQIGYGTQAWADHSQEIGQYLTLGDGAVSGLEALGMGWLFFSVASAIWIAYHARRRLPEMAPAMRAAWALLALLLGPVAVVLYVASNRRRPGMAGHHGEASSQQPTWARVISATVMMFSFDMMLMVLVTVALVHIGLPAIPMSGPIYPIGSSMILMMVLMYVIALAIMVPVFHAPMHLGHLGGGSYRRALRASIAPAAAAMAAESVGMMPVMWWSQMIYLPGMQMPTADDLTLWITLLVSAAAGFATALPYHYWQVRRGAAAGEM